VQEHQVANMPPRPRKFVALAAGIALLGSTWAALAGESVAVPSRVIYPGETLEPAALREVALGQGKRAPDAVAMAAADIEGKVARRTLLPGRYIPLNSLRDAYVVEQGAPVQVMFVA